MRCGAFGKIVKIVYDGTIQETDPATFGGVFHVSVVVENESSDCKAVNPEGLQIGIDNVTYVCTDIEALIEPDDSAVEHVEILHGGDAEISSFARIQEGSERYLVCLIGEEWFKFVAE